MVAASFKGSQSETSLSGLLGLQVNYAISNNIGFYAYADYRAGETLDLSDAGMKYGEFDTTGWQSGIGITVSF